MGSNMWRLVTILSSRKWKLELLNGWAIKSNPDQVTNIKRETDRQKAGWSQTDRNQVDQENHSQFLVQWTSAKDGDQLSVDHQSIIIGFPIE